MENKAKTQNVDSNKFIETWSLSIGPGDKGDVWSFVMHSIWFLPCIIMSIEI